MASNIQFFGSESVLQAYRLRGLDNWAIFQGRDLLTAGSGEDSLTAWLARLESSTATYKLKVYAAEGEPDDIDDATPANGSFNFKCLGNPVASTLNSNAAVGSAGVAGIIQRKIEAKLAGHVDKWLDKLNLDDSDEDEEPATVSGVLMGFLKEPEKIPALLNGVRALLQGVTPNPGTQPVYSQPMYAPEIQPQPAAIGNAAAVSLEDKYNRIGAAIDTMEKADPDIMFHLEKLAKISREKPETFRQLIGMLKAF